MIRWLTWTTKKGEMKILRVTKSHLITVVELIYHSYEIIVCVYVYNNVFLTNTNSRPCCCLRFVCLFGKLFCTSGLRCNPQKTATWNDLGSTRRGAYTCDTCGFEDAGAPAVQQYEAQRVKSLSVRCRRAQGLRSACSERSCGLIITEVAKDIQHFRPQ